MASPKVAPGRAGVNGHAEEGGSWGSDAASSSPQLLGLEHDVNGPAQQVPGASSPCSTRTKLIRPAQQNAPFPIAPCSANAITPLRGVYFRYSN